jgi:hypothetical protein
MKQICLCIYTTIANQSFRRNAVLKDIVYVYTTSEKNSQRLILDH